MNINQIAERYKDELPGYKLVCYCETGFPIYQCTLHCLSISDAQIPVVEEFVLNFYAQGLQIKEIAGILGLDYDLVEEAWTKLLQRDYINPVTKHITSTGVDYLEHHKVDKLEKSLVPVCVDGLTSKIRPKSSQLMSNKNAKEIGIRTLRAVIDRPDIENIEFNQVKRVLKEYQKIDKESYSSNILEIVHVEGRTTKYKRLNILGYINNENNIRFLVYDGLDKLEGYENALLQLEDRGVAVFKYLYGKYFESDKIGIINDYIKTNKNKSNLIGPGRIWELWNEYLSTASKEVLIVLPLVDSCTPSNYWIESLVKVLEKDVAIYLVISGRELVNVYQKSQYEQIIKLKDRYKKFKLIQIPDYYNKALIIDKKKGIISSFEKHNLGLNSSKEGITEFGCSIDQEEIDDFIKLLPCIKKLLSLKSYNLDNIDRRWLKDKIGLICKLVNDFDNSLYAINSIGWIGEGPIPEYQALISAPLAKDNELFKTFINALNKSLIESLEVNGKSRGVKNYFWTDIKNSYPTLHRILLKIKVYRNNADHLILDDQNKELYYQFLQEDLDGRLPDFLDNGFMQLQVNILNELEQALRKVL